MLTWQPSQRTRGLLSGAHLRAKSAAAEASKIKKNPPCAQGLGVDPATCGQAVKMLTTTPLDCLWLCLEQYFLCSVVA